jgi:putative endonuclease
MKKLSHQKLGQLGESAATKYLEENSYFIIARNVRTKYGEIDIIASHNTPEYPKSEMLVFIEVKTRSSTSLGFPEISVTPRKQEHLLAAIDSYLQDHPDIRNDWRVDVISVQYSASSLQPQITHFENAITDR